MAEGLRADLNVIDFDHAALASRRRWPTTCPRAASGSLQGARGYRATVVAGEVTYRDGEPTGALPGRLVRGGRAGG